MAIEIVDLIPLKMVIFNSYVKLPEGIFFFRKLWWTTGLGMAAYFQTNPVRWA